MLTDRLEGSSRMRDLGAPAALVLVLLLLGSMIGAATGLAPLIAVPIALLAAAVALAMFGTAAAKSALGSSTGWHGLVLFAFWALVVNVPTFLSFDPTGFTREHGLFNAQSIARITIFVATVVALIFFWLLWGQDARLDENARLPRGAWLLFAPYLWYLATSALAVRGSALGVSAFRVFEWIVALVLLCMAFALQNANGKRTFPERARVLWPMLAFLVLSNLVLLPLLPGQIYRMSSVTGAGRLGNLFTHPNLLAIAATLVMAYALAFHNGWRRALYAIVAAIVAVLTYSRGGYVALAVTLLLAPLLLMRGIGRKALVIALVVAGAAGMMALPEVNDAVYRYLARGHESSSLQTLSERTAVWQAARTQIARSPWLGEGFLSGPKRLGEIMVEQRLSSNFAAQHAHNELLQAQISGGIVAVLLVLAIHLRIAYQLLRPGILSGRERFFGWSVFLCCLVWGALAPSLSYFLSLPGVLLAWLLLSLEGVAATEVTAAGLGGPARVMQGASGKRAQRTRA